MKKMLFALSLVSVVAFSELSAMSHLFRHPKDIVRHPKKAVTAVVRVIENKVLEPIAHAVENEVVEPAANGVNDHIVKPFARGFKHKIEKHAEHDGEVAADIAHEVVVEALTGVGQDDGSTGQKPTKRPCK